MCQSCGKETQCNCGQKFELQRKWVEAWGDRLEWVHKDTCDFFIQCAPVTICKDVVILVPKCVIIPRLFDGSCSKCRKFKCECHIKFVRVCRRVFFHGQKRINCPKKKRQWIPKCVPVRICKPVDCKVPVCPEADKCDPRDRKPFFAAAAAAGPVSPTKPVVPAGGGGGNGNGTLLGNARRHGGGGSIGPDRTFPTMDPESFGRMNNGEDEDVEVAAADEEGDIVQQPHPTEEEVHGGNTFYVQSAGGKSGGAYPSAALLDRHRRRHY